MKLTFLGTGTSTGIPAVGCRCAVCMSVDNRDRRLRTSAIVSNDEASLLIDCVPDFRQQILRVGSPSLRALLVTHSHYDHVGGIDDLRPYCHPDGFDVYCNAATDSTLHTNYPYCYAEKHYPGAPMFQNHVIEPMKEFEIDGFSILPLAVSHYLMSILGFRINHTLAYITDAKTIPTETIDAIRGVDTLVINALRHKPHISHMNLNEALDVIKAVKPRVAYLTHIGHDLGFHAETEPCLPEGVHLAYDGLTIDI